MKYYVDTCIWIDYYENRTDKFRPLGEWALEFFKQVIRKGDFILISKHVFDELYRYGYESDEISDLLSVIPNHLLVIIEDTEIEFNKSYLLSKKLHIPNTDILHAVIARENNAIMVTRDRHFEELFCIVEIRKPEDLIHT